MEKLSVFRRFCLAEAAASILIFLAVGGSQVAAQTPATAPSNAADTQAPAGQKPDGQKPEDKKSDSRNPAETVRVNVNVVGLFFNVNDKHGALMPNLMKDDFQVFEDGKPQTIKYF